MPIDAEMNNRETIRNFVVIAHIDHGKSTLADRFLEYTKTVEARKMKPQLLDQMDLERERGITIKMQPARMAWGGYILNLIDTPGHIDFSYEVSRALVAVEGAVLLVDATQGVQAQTLTNLHIALEEGLAIIPAVNKIDATGARVEETAIELAALLHCNEEQVARVSGKTGAGVPELLERIVRSVPSPQAGDVSACRALIFDSTFENHRGVIAYVRVFGGEVKQGDSVRLAASGVTCEVKEVGYFTPARLPAPFLRTGEIGYVVTGIKDPLQVRIGDTIGINGKPVQPLPGYQTPRPVIWASIYPQDERDYDTLRDALSRLRLNDASLVYEAESSPVLGRSFTCGFLGMLHLEIVTERLRREFNASVVTTSPSIAYHIIGKNGITEVVTSAAKFPDRADSTEVQEPWMAAEIIVPNEYIGEVLRLVDAYEGSVLSSEPFGGRKEDTTGSIRIKLACEMPLREIVSDFFDALKSCTAGYASLSYTPARMRRADVERIDIYVAEEPVPALSRIVSAKKAQVIARKIVTRLKEVLPRQLFQVKIQAYARGRIVAAEVLSALKKDVAGYLYGGDRSRKMKLWKKQKRGKKKLAEQGKVRIPPEAYLNVLKRG
jgi:GTP-binding protein LepA